MRRLLPVAVLLVGVPLATSAPVPRPGAERFEKAFGKAVSPVKGLEFKFDGKTLTAKMPKDRVGHEEDFRKGYFTQKTISGDFELVAAIRTTVPNVPPMTTNGRCMVGGGLAAWEPDAKPDDKKFVSVCRTFWESKGSWLEETIAHFLDRSQADDAEGEIDPSRLLYLRLNRTGDTMETDTSTDGKKWENGWKNKVGLGKTLSVGVWSFNTTETAVDVVFEHVTVNPLK